MPIARSKNRWAASASRRGGHEHIDHLAELVDRSIDVAPPAGDLHIRLVDLPAVTDGMPTRPSGVGQQRREQHPAVDRDVVDLDPALGQQLLDVAVGQAEAQLPADREDDDIEWEAKPAKADRVAAGRGWRVLIPAVSLPGRGRRGCSSTERVVQGDEVAGVAILVVGTLLAFASAGRSCWALRS